MPQTNPLNRLKSSAGNPGDYPTQSRPDRRVVWEWNKPLLLTTTIVCVVLLSAVSSMYFWQSRRLALGLLQRAEASEQSGELQEQARWLSRYVNLVPDDVNAQITLAQTVDSLADTSADIDRARRQLSVALAACGESAIFEEQKKNLRGLLIKRLLQLGPLWAIEAEKQVLALNAESGDAEATKWLTQSVVAQQIDSKFEPRDANEFDRESNYWQWFASQPPGEMLILALEVNPDDLDLAGSFLSASTENRDWFVTPEQELDDQRLNKLSQQVVSRLRDRTDSGRAQLMAYSYLLDPQPAAAREVIANAIGSALDRLSAHTESMGETTAREADAATQLESLAGSAPIPSANDYQPFWDWQLAAEAARLSVVEEDYAQAKQVYLRLLACDTPAISPQQREATYVAYGALLSITDGIKIAIDHWKIGEEKLPDSLELSRLLANAYASERDLTQAWEYVKKYQDIIRVQRDRLDGTYGAQLSTFAKQAIRQRLDTAQWEVLLLQARLSLAKEDFVAASNHSRKAFESPLVLGSESRIQAGQLLAESYSRRELWDMVGQTLDRCVSLAPNDTSLRRMAAAAWRNTGTADRAAQQLAKLDDGSFESALEIARVTLMSEVAKPRELADMPAVVKAIQLARQRYEQAPADVRSTLNGWQLELLELNFAVDNAEQVATPEQRLDQLQAIAQAHPGVSEVQMLAATSLAAGGRPEDSQQAIGRLKDIATASGESADSANLALAIASSRVAGGEIQEAITEIKSAIQRFPDQQLRLAKSGADLVLRNKQFNQAYALLRSIPEEKLDTDALMSLANLANLVQAEGSQSGLDITQDLSRWIDRLKAIEGDEGTHWRYLTAQQLLLKSKTASNPQEQLNEATRLFNEIDARRPHWGAAAALGGQIAAQKGFSNDAIALLRRAIRDGDRQLNTVWLLVSELKATNHLEEAEQELQRMGSVSASFLPMSAMLVDLAQGRGDFDRAVTVARDLVASQSSEYTSWLVLAQALLTASNRSGISPDAKQAMLVEGWQALEKAKELSQGKDVSVWDARFRFQLASGDNAAAEQELIALQQTAIKSDVRLLAAGRGYLLLKNFDKARSLFEASLAMNPKSSEAYLALADMHNRMGDATASLEALRSAQAASPENQELRERLAINLAFGAVGDAGQTDQQLAEINKLLSNVSIYSSPRARLVKALIELSKGNAQQQNDAQLALREIARAPSMEGDDANRILSGYFARLWLSQPTETDSPAAQRNFSDAVRFFDNLAGRASPNGLDVARYADFLLKAYVVERNSEHVQLAQSHLAEAERIVQKLESISGSSIASLQLKVRLAIANGKSDEIEALTSGWVQGAGELDAVQEQRAWELAGRTLGDLGLAEDSIVWMEQVYEQDPSKYQLLVVALAKAQQIDRALQISLVGYHSNPSAEAAALIAEVAMTRVKVALSADIEEALREALEKFNSSAQFLEAYATLRLMQERFDEAATWFDAVEKLSPGRVRTLNNLAMALSELPMGKELALQKINQAIDIQGRLPELLDTLGLVLLRNGRFDEARKVLTEAVDRLNDPRFSLHLAQVAFAQDDLKQAQQAWQQIDRSKLADSSLTSQEQAVLAKLEKLDSQEQR